GFLSFFSRCPLKGQKYLEDGPFAEGTPQLDLAAHALQKFTHDGKPQTHPLCAVAAAGGLGVGLEDPGLKLLGHPLPTVAHDKLYALLQRNRFKPDVALVGIFHRVAEEIAKNLSD